MPMVTNRSPMEQQERKAPRKRKTSRGKITKLFFTLVIGYLVLTFTQGFYKAHQLQEEIQVLESELAELKKENNELQDELKYMQSPEAVEKIAREKLGLIKSGEVVIMRAKELQQ